MTTGRDRGRAPAARVDASGFDPGAALAALDDRQRGQRCEPSAEAASAWDAAWIACLTGSPRWTETARREFARLDGAER